MQTPAVSTSTASTSATTPQSTLNPTHEIEIDLEDLKNGYYRFPNMNVEETVRYTCKDGEVTLHFTGNSPFRLDDVAGTQVPGGVILTLVQSSEGLPNDAFHVGCSVTITKTGEVVGWPKLKSAGGDLGVGRPHH
jgi:hypothetical protein